MKIALEKIAWKKDFSVGVAELDEQHKKLVELINSLVDLATTGATRAEVDDVLTEMTRYAIQHFRAEEQLMLTYNYPGYLDQEAAHNKFRKSNGRFHLRAAEDENVDTGELVEFLKGWLVNHIQIMDKQYSAFFKEKGVQ